MLVVDGSQSIMPDNFDTLIRFVVRVTRQFDISPEATRMGLVQFSDRSKVEIGLGDITDEGALETRIMNITYQNGGDTFTGEAIRLATDQLLNSLQARNVSKLMFLFTDGQPTRRDNAIRAGEEARNENITITAVGIAITVQDALNMITGSSDRVLLVETFSDELLNDIIDDLTTQACPSM